MPSTFKLFPMKRTVMKVSHENTNARSLPATVVPSSGRYFVSTHCIVSFGNYVRHVGSQKHMNSQIAGEWTPSPPAVINLALTRLVSFPLLTYRRTPHSST